jgi:DNA gyrase inhibitor GyrI
MEDLNVRIVRLAPMRVASAHGLGASPEGIAWQTLLDWAKTGRLLEVEPAPRFFGFNNPNPAAGSPNYGYEQWMTVSLDVAGSGGVTIKEFAGGLYAITRCEGLLTITDTWHRLATWCEGSPYIMGQHQWLEECFTPDAARLEDYFFDLYLPIAE